MVKNKTLIEPKIVYKKGKVQEVIFSWRDFQKILEIIEDVYDAKYIRQIKN